MVKLTKSSCNGKEGFASVYLLRAVSIFVLLAVAAALNTSAFSAAAAKAACVAEAETIQLGIDVCMADNHMTSLIAATTIGPGNTGAGTWPITNGTNVGYVGEYLRKDIKGTYRVSISGLVTVLIYPGLTGTDLTKVNNRLKGS